MDVCRFKVSCNPVQSTRNAFPGVLNKVNFHTGVCESSILSTFSRAQTSLIIERVLDMKKNSSSAAFLWKIFWRGHNDHQTDRQTQRRVRLRPPHHGRDRQSKFLLRIYRDRLSGGHIAAMFIEHTSCYFFKDFRGFFKTWQDIETNDKLCQPECDSGLHLRLSARGIRRGNCLIGAGSSFSNEIRNNRYLLLFNISDGFQPPEWLRRHHEV